MKKVICIALAVLTLVSVMSFAVSAKNISLPGDRTWIGPATCTLKKNALGKPKNGVVRVNLLDWGYNADIKMEADGKIVWSQNNAIKSGASRNFDLGNDHSVYKLYFRCSRSGLAGTGLSIVNKKNVTVK